MIVHCVHYVTLIFIVIIIILCITIFQHRAPFPTPNLQIGSSRVYISWSSLTISNDEEEPPLSRESTEDYHQEEVKHDPLTQHPAEGR